MSTDLRTLHLTTIPEYRHDERIRPVSVEDLAALSATYLDAYPPQIGAADEAEAMAEIGDTFAGNYGELIPAACLGAEVGGHVVGAVFTTTRSIWDDLDGPFVIDLFVRRDHRGRGLARALIEGAIAACAATDASTVSLRVGDGTSAAAHALYRHLGFVDATR